MLVASCASGRRRLGCWTWCGLAMLAFSRLVWAESERPGRGAIAAESPWRIVAVAVRPEAHAGAAPEAREGSGERYLHVEIAFPSEIPQPKLHQFRVVDAQSKPVAEVYGFDKGRSVVVFEGHWSDLHGLYLEGQGYREPLFQTALSSRSSSAQKADSAPGTGPTQPALPLAASRASEAGQRLYQEVTVTHQSHYRIQGLDVSSNLQYRVLSDLQVRPDNSDGSLNVTQRVEQAEIIQADSLSRAVFADLLKELVGTTFRYTLDAGRKVIRFEGTPPKIRAAGPDVTANSGVLLASVIDSDGWKELAELTFLQPPKLLGTGQPWQRPLTHSWGPLGSWSGQAVFQYAGKEEQSDRIDYQLRLTHQMRKGEPSGLPFRLVGAEFRHQQAGGTVLYDPAQQRVIRAVERFPVQGTLTIESLGQVVPLELDEQQTFTLRVLDHAP